MNENVLGNKLGELVDMLASVPPAKDGNKGTYVSLVTPAADTNTEEVLDHLRLQIRYLLFDLQATRRENRYLREMLERRSNFGDNGEQG